jgi:PAS domain S-box-containing protein
VSPSKLKILVVDDDPDLLQGTARLLEKAGDTVARAATGAAALQAVQAHPPDLLLLDRQLPDMDGLEVCRRLKADPATANIIVVILSGAHVRGAEQIAGLALGADGYIVRPIGNEELRVRIEAFARLARLNLRLAEEIAQRRRLETDLEERVRTRTAELLATNQQLQTAQQAALDSMRDSTRAQEHLACVNQRLRQEIVEREQAQDALRAASLYARNLIETSLDPLVTISAAGKITDVNTATEKITGRSRERLIGSDFADYMADPPLVRAGYSKVFAEGQITNYPLAICHASGAITEVLCNASVYRNEQGEVLGILAAARDITTLKRAEAGKAHLEAQNRQLQKAESLGRMAGAIAHHFNNQLQAVLLNLELALHDLPRQAGSGENLAAALQAAHKAAEVSGLMLTYLGQKKAEREPLDLSAACQHSLLLLRATLPGGVVLETDFPAPGPTIRSSANQIQQVLANLVTNACEAMQHLPGSIRLTVRTVAAARLPTAQHFPADWRPQAPAYACLAVADTGSGILGPDVEKVFDPFFSTKFTGRGLGLAVVLGIVRAHDGAITVESQPGQGSVFRVFLPVSTIALAHPPAAVVPAPTSAGSGTVLVVDDEPVIRRTVALALKRFGFTVLEAEDGVAAVALFGQCPAQIRCVLCDLTMPRMNGWETLAALRKLRPGIPVILSSGYSEAQALAGQHPERPQAFLRKPYEIKALYAAFTQALAHRPDSSA